jgi:hypothetical protein
VNLVNGVGLLLAAALGAVAVGIAVARLVRGMGRR